MTFDGSSLPDHPALPAERRRAAALRLVERVVPQLFAGRLQVVLPGGARIERQGRMPGPEATLVVRRWRALWRMLYQGEKGFSDGYIADDWSTPDLYRLLEFGMRNEEPLSSFSSGSWFTRLRDRAWHRSNRNTRRGSRRNIAAHYDLGNSFYSQWLDLGMNYSSAYYAGEQTLEVAQSTKLDRIASLLALSGGERVLEIGFGWGALAERLARRHGVHVTGLTLSSEQLGFARDRLASEIERGAVELCLQDYRDVSGQFDRIVSIEMIEAVGEGYWPTYFEKLQSSLAGDGVAVLQVITIEDSRFDAYRTRPDFIQRHIFPGGMLPTPSIIEREAAAAGLTVAHREAFGESYARTLREWRARFLRAWPKIETFGFDRRFRNMWEYYLAYCEVGFRLGILDVSLLTLKHRR
jgi:cyclopropane-fatty-acyl-phospholipid synthase